MAWIVRLVSTGVEGDERSTDVMRIAKPDELGDLANLGLTLARASCSWPGSSGRSSPHRPGSTLCAVPIAEAATVCAG